MGNAAGGMNDEQVRIEALDTGRSFIVQAPAGSGKTTLLISRFIRLLAIVDQPEEILAMTFTRKATAEMRERILEVLDPNSEKQLPEEIANQAVETVRKRSVDLGWDLQNQPSRLQIVTIDALASALIRQMPWASRFGSAPSLTDNADDLYRTSAVNTFELEESAPPEFRSALRTLYSQIDNNSGTFQELIIEMLKKRDQWLRILVKNSFSEEEKFQMEEVWKRLLTIKMAEVKNLLPESMHQILRLNDINAGDSTSLDFWRTIAGLLLLKNAPEWRKRITPSDLSHDFDKEKIKASIDQCVEVPQLAEKLYDLGNKFPYPEYRGGQWKVLQAISIVLQYAVAQLRLEFRKRGEVDFIEIAQQAELALGPPDNPTDLSLVLDYQYRHILVDEFQDTSISQRNLLKSLTGGWQSNDQRTLFVVGDPMQSIYGFREADVGIYLSVVKNGLGNIRPTPLRLSRNFRSNANLVKWFNTVFEVSFPAQSDVTSGQVSYAPCTSDIEPKEDKSVKIWLQPKVDELGKKLQSDQLPPIEARQVVTDIKLFLERNAGEGMQAAVIVRSRNHANEILPLLDEAQIRYYAADIFPLKGRPVVKDLLSLARALLNLADRTSWFAILRAPWCGLTLDDLLVVAADDRTTIWNCLNNDDVLQDLTSDGRQRAERVCNVLNRAFSIRGRFDVRQWIEDTWVLLGGPACVTNYDIENARLFLDLVGSYCHGTGVEYLKNFEDQMGNLYAVPEYKPEDVSVHISTIHGVKGLEYDAVFIPAFDKGTGRSNLPLLIWSEFLLDETAESKLLISPIANRAAEADDQMYNFLKQWNREKTLTELTRLAYVACTRAKCELYIYGAKTNDDDFPINPETLLSRLWPGISASEFKHVVWTDPIVAEDVETDPEKKPSQAPILTRLPNNWSLPATPEPLKLPDREFETPGDYESIDFDWAGSVALWIGSIVHKWLERIVRSGIENWSLKRLKQERPKWKSALLSMGMSQGEEELNAALNRVEKALENVFKDPKGQWLLSSGHRQAEAELRLTGYIDGGFRNVILDRTFVDDRGIRWIVDYKAGSTDGNVREFLDNEEQRYRDQLQMYKRIVSGFEERPIRLGLYFPMFPEWRELQ